MIYAVFLCDKQWKIKRIRQGSLGLKLCEGDVLSDIVEEPWKLGKYEERQYSLELTFKESKRTMPAIIYSYKEGTLVVLAQVSNSQEFLEFNNEYPKYQEWAKDHIFGLFHNEYYMIQQANNQLVDARRRLTRSNRKLEQALRENEEINHRLDEARLLAERASASKTRFLANMSHDIRTPMNAIVGLAELMQHHLHEPELIEGYLGKLRSSSRYLLDLINDILELSKIETGSLKIVPEPMDIGAQIEQIVTIIRPQITKKKQKLSVQGEDAEYGYLVGDPVRFRQVLMNVFSNAIKYTPEGGSIRFSIHETDIEEERKYLFVIEDSGIGMSKEFLEHIFEPFARAEDSVKEIQGTGLGMAITKNIVDAMNGDIRVYSTIGEGSRFEIELPFRVYKGERLSDTPTKMQSETVQKDSMNLEGKRFLCAEDNELNAEILTAMLEMAGAECVVYGNGKLLLEAFEKMEPGEYDAILMDVQMPVMDGLTATIKIRASEHPDAKRIPIIAMTANAFKEDEEKCLAAGMNAHLAKPLELEKMRQIIREQIGKTE